MLYSQNYPKNREPTLTLPYSTVKIETTQTPHYNKPTNPTKYYERLIQLYIAHCIEYLWLRRLSLTIVSNVDNA